MNTFYKIAFSIILIAQSCALISKNDDITNRYLEMQFAPNYPAPVAQDKDDQYFFGLLRNIIKTDMEIQNDLLAKKSSSITDMIVRDDSNYVLESKDKSFGWNDPLAIASAIWFNGTAETPNRLIVTIENSIEFPGKLKATITGKGLYAHEENRTKSAQSELTSYLNNGPAKISKYANLENITTMNKLIDHNKQEINKVERKKLLQSIPTLQGQVKCDRYLHGTDVSAIIYFEPIVAAYLIQEINGNRYKKNEAQKNQSAKQILAAPDASTAQSSPINPLQLPTSVVKTKPSIPTDVINQNIGAAQIDLEHVNENEEDEDEENLDLDELLSNDSKDDENSSSK